MSSLSLSLLYKAKCIRISLHIYYFICSPFFLNVTPSFYIQTPFWEVHLLEFPTVSLCVESCLSYPPEIAFIFTLDCEFV